MNCLGQAKLKLSLLKYGQSEGLSSYNIRNILKDKKGFLWIASQDGLARFDGRDFRHYTKQAPAASQLSGADIRALVEEPNQHALFVLPDRNGLDMIGTNNGTVLKHFAIPSYHPQDWNITMAACRNNLWIGSFCGLKIFDLKHRRFLSLPRHMQQKRSATGIYEANFIIRDNADNVWVCYTGYGVVVYDGSSFAELAVMRVRELGDHNASGRIRVNDMAFLNDHEALMATTQGLRKVSFDKNYTLKADDRPVRSLSTLNDVQTDAVCIIGPGQLLISGNSNLYRFDALLEKYVVYDESIGQAESKWINYVQAIFRQGNEVWLSCQQGAAMMRLDASPFTKYYYDEKTGIKLEHLRSIYVKPNNDILAGLSSGLVEIQQADNAFTFLDRRHLYHHIFSFPGSPVLLFREDGMFTLASGRISPLTRTYREFSRYSTYAVNSHILLGDTAVVLGTENDNGILLWNYKRHQVRKLDIFSKPALASNSVNNIYRDKRGRFWVLSDKVITILSPDLLSAQPLHLAHLELFFDMCEAGGNYWLTSYGNGLIKLDQRLQVKQQFGTRQGLSNDGVYNIFNLGDSSLLVTTNNGLAHYLLKKNMSKNYYVENGLQSNSFEEVTAVRERGKIYAGGINGFTVIEPNKLRYHKTPPTLYIKNIDIKLSNGRNLVNTELGIHSLKIPSDWLQVNIAFVGLNFTAPKRVSFKYRINEIDTSWVSNGFRDQISLMGLPPATYRLEFKAANEDGYWSTPRSLLLYIQPKWFQTIWFKIAIILLVAAIITAFYQYRIKQIKIQHSIRREIANDLHDDLGGNLNAIKIFTHLAIGQLGKLDALNEIENLISNTAAGLRDMLWVLEGTQDTAGDLAERIRRFAEPLAEARKINFCCDVESRVADVALSKIEKRNLLLIAKEAFNNCFKYATCQKLHIFIKSETGQKITLGISDDGLGFDTLAQSGGYGLNNIRYRAKQINYSVEIQSSQGNGTTIVVQKK
ncbi:two-component regulator propeller domain-containing protein [Mucilaginibacter sp. HD30]